MYLPHPLGITLRQVIIDRYNMYAFAGQGIQISRQRRDQRLAFTGTHLRDTPLMENDTADDLDPEMPKPKHPHRCLPHYRKCLRQHVVQRLAIGEPCLKFSRLILQFTVRQLLHHRLKRLNLIHDRIDPL